MQTVTYYVPNISCKHCVHTIQMEVGELEGVESVVAEVDTKRVKIVFDAPAGEDSIKMLLDEINFPVQEEK